MTEDRMNPAASQPHSGSAAAPESERLDRVRVTAVDEILGYPFRVLDDGFVRVIDYMGSDQSIVQAARVSYGAGTKRVNEDRGLIRYLMRHSHTTPFEMCEIKLHVRVPMDTWRQWIRHRTANVNEYSTRYSIAIDTAQRTPPGEWRLQSPSNRQGSSGVLDLEAGSRMSVREAEAQRLAREVYNERLTAGVAREQARKDLPLSTYTEAYWKIDLHNLLHFLRLRLDSHAQHEIRRYAEVIGSEIVARWCPIAWDGFQDYIASGLVLLGAEVQIIACLIAGQESEAASIAEAKGLVRRAENGELVRSRERSELEVKLERLGIRPPWR